MEKVLADFLAKSTLNSRKKRIEEFEIYRIILSNKRLILVNKSDKITVPLTTIFDVRKISVPDELKDVMEDSLKIAFYVKKPNILIIKSKSEIIYKFFKILMRLLLTNKSVVYKYPAIKGGRVLNVPWKNGILKIGDGSVFLDNIRIEMSKIRDVKKEYKLLENKKAETLDFKIMANGELIVSYVHADKKTLNLFGRYLSYEYVDLLRIVKKVQLTSYEKQILYAMHSGIRIEDLPEILGIEAVDAHRMTYNLEKKGLIRGEKLTPYGEVAINRYIEDINV